MLIVAIVTLGTALALGVFLLLDKRTEEENASVVVAEPLAADRVRGRPADDEVPSLFRRVGTAAAKLTPADYTRRLQRRLDVAGNPKGWEPERVLAYKGIGLLGLGLLGFALGSEYGPLVTILGLVGGALAGFYLPDLWLKNLGDKRQLELRKGLPDAIDMMTVCVEAGLGFDAAISRVALNMAEPTSLEFARVMQERQFGKSRVEALRAMSERSTVAEVRTFSSALIQSSELGISIGDVLRSQSHDMRIKRRQRAEELAQKLPVKILFPLLACIFPVLFIVVLGPAAIGIWESITGLVP